MPGCILILKSEGPHGSTKGFSTKESNLRSLLSTGSIDLRRSKYLCDDLNGAYEKFIFTLNINNLLYYVGCLETAYKTHFTFQFYLGYFFIFPQGLSEHLQSFATVICQKVVRAFRYLTCAILHLNI